MEYERFYFFYKFFAFCFGLVFGPWVFLGSSWNMSSYLTYFVFLKPLISFDNIHLAFQNFAFRVNLGGLEHHGYSKIQHNHALIVILGYIKGIIDMLNIGGVPSVTSMRSCPHHVSIRLLHISYPLPLIHRDIMFIAHHWSHHTQHLQHTYIYVYMW